MKKTLFAVLAAAFVFSLSSGFARANDAMEQLRGANRDANLTFDGSRNASGAPAVNPAAAASGLYKAGAPAAEPEKPSLFKKMGEDLKKKKMDFALAGGSAMLAGAFLFGTLGAGAICAGVFILFLLLLRNV